jgi:hypothetical protein
VNIRLKNNGQTALTKNAINVIYFLFYKFNKFDNIPFDFLLNPYIFCSIIFLHLYLVIKGEMQGHSLIKTCNTSINTVILNTSTEP